MCFIAWVLHHHEFNVTVNNQIVDIPSFRVKENYEVQIRDDFKENTMLEDAIKLSKAVSSVPEWVEVDYDGRTGKIVRLPARQDVLAAFNEQLVVELYSK